MKRKCYCGHWTVLSMVLSLTTGSVALADGVSLSANPASVTFAPITAGTSEASTVTVTGRGEESTALTAISVSTKQYAVTGGTCLVGTRIGGKAPTCTVVVTFKPTLDSATTKAVTLADSLVVSTNRSSVTVALSGTANPAKPVATLTGGSFGQVGLLTTATTDLTLTNTGPVALQIGSVSFTSGFSQSATTCGTSLAAGQACKITVSVTPQSAGSVTGSASLTSNAVTSPLTAPLSVTAVAPKATLSPASASFGTVIVGSSSPSTTFTLTNAGSLGKLSVSSVLASGDYTVTSDQCSGKTLSVGSSCNVGVTFKPSASGARTGTLTVASNASNGSVTAALTGTGIQKQGILTVTPSTLTFTSKCRGEGSGAGSQSIAVSNSSNGDLTGLTVAESGTGFSINASCPSTLGAGNRCNVSVRFTANRSSTGSVLISATGQSASVALTGTCTTPASP